MVLRRFTAGLGGRVPEYGFLKVSPPSPTVFSILCRSLVVSILAFVAGSCSNGEGNAGAPEAASTIRYPFLELLETSIDRDASDLLFATADAQSAFVKDCMAEGGFKGSVLQFPDSESIEKEVVYYPRTTSQLIGQLRSTQLQTDTITTGSGSASERLAESQRFEECGASARKQFTNPAEPFFVWMISSMSEVNDRASVMPDYRSADETFEACLNEVGLGAFDDEAAVANHYQSQQASILDRLQGGTLLRDQAIEALLPIATEENLIAEPLNNCITRREDARQRILAPLEEVWIEANSAAVDEQIKELLPRLRNFDTTISDADTGDATETRSTLGDTAPIDGSDQ